jgi:hypothetical protein
MATEDDDVTQGPDEIETDETGADIEPDSEDEDAEDEGDKPKPKAKAATAEPQTVAELTTLLKAANARATQASRAAARERKTRAAAGVDKNGKKTADKAVDPEDRSQWPEAARKHVEKLEAEATATIEQRDKAQAAAKDKAIRDGLVAAGLRVPKDSDDARKTFKRAMRLLDADTIEIDEDGDVIGVEDEIENVKAMLPDLFGAPKAADEDEDITPTPKPRVNPGGGKQKVAVEPKSKFPSTAAYLVSSEYARRNEKQQQRT